MGFYRNFMCKFTKLMKQLAVFRHNKGVFWPVR